MPAICFVSSSVCVFLFVFIPCNFLWRKHTNRNVRQSSVPESTRFGANTHKRKLKDTEQGTKNHSAKSSTHKPNEKTATRLQQLDVENNHLERPKHMLYAAENCLIIYWKLPVTQQVSWKWFFFLSLFRQQRLWHRIKDPIRHHQPVGYFLCCVDICSWVSHRVPSTIQRRI